MRAASVMTACRGVPGRCAGALLALLVAIASGPAAAQQERILSYHADIAIEADGSLTVSETIEAVAAGERINRGIYRDFPTIYTGRFGLRRTVGFELVGTWRNGQPEPHRIEPLSNGVRIYIGDPGRRVTHGAHTWRIVYRTDRQLRFLDEVDELYWNVTGNGWVFPIDSVTARIRLPAGARVVDAAGYTGYFGDSGDDYRMSTDAGGMPVFATSRTLNAGEGLTVAVSWPKGLVPPPDGTDARRNALAANAGVLIALAGLVLVFAYFLVMWLRVGRDPPKGVIFPRFEAPHGLSPVAIGYIANNGFGSAFSTVDAFAAALTSLAVKGAVTLTEGEKAVTVTRTGNGPANLPPGEKAMMSTLFAKGDEVVLGGSYDRDIGTAVRTLGKVAAQEYSNDYFRSNIGVWLPGGLVAIATAVAALILDTPVAEDGIIVVAMFIFPLAFGFASFLLARHALPTIRQALGGRRRRIGKAIGAAAMPLVVLVPVVGVLAMMTLLVSLPVVVLTVALILAAIVFAVLLRAPTMQGRKALDEIEGYKLYLSVAEGDRLDMAAQRSDHEPEMTVERFETHLPYAMALGIADAWSEKFASRVNMAEPGAPGSSRAYRPRWYRSRSRFASPAGLTDHLSRSLGRTISSASTAPSSSGGSASRGRGSSGRGGGGGGGGGW